MNPNTPQAKAGEAESRRFSVIQPYAYTPRRNLHPQRPLNFQGGREAAHQLTKRMQG